jgi:hypothetical protein
MEGTLFAIETFLSPTNLTATALNKFIETTYGTLATQVSKYYSLDQFGKASTAPFYAYSQIITDSGFKCPARMALNATRKANMSAYTYEDTHVPSCSWNAAIQPAMLPVLGSTHSAELYVVFNQLRHLSYPSNGSCTASPFERTISTVLVEAWTSMAVNATPASASMNGTQWPEWSLASSAGFIIGQDSLTAGAINYTVCDDLWDQVLLLQLDSDTSNATSSIATGSDTSFGASAGATLSIAMGSATPTGASAGATFSVLPSTNDVALRRAVAPTVLVASLAVVVLSAL